MTGPLPVDRYTDMAGRSMKLREPSAVTLVLHDNTLFWRIVLTTIDIYQLTYCSITVWDYVWPRAWARCALGTAFKYSNQNVLGLCYNNNHSKN